MIRVFLAGAAVAVVLTGVPSSAEEPVLNGDSLNSSEVCAECHQEIHGMWSRSMHSASYSDPIFKFSYMQAYFETNGEASKTCLQCHAPVAYLTGDMHVENEISLEGITCDFCHSVASVDLSREGFPFDVKLDGIKRGPLTNSVSPAHEVTKSELHKSSEFCAGCHEWQNSRGVAVLSTYSEWKSSSVAAEGKTCQSCHMPLLEGRTVKPGLGSDRRTVNLHNISGMHSNEQVRNSAEAKILKLNRRKGGRAVVVVEVANVGSGHAIPTGLSTRKLVLEVALFCGGKFIRRFEKVYQRKLGDETGRHITVDHRSMLEAATVLEDNRLRPGERREEKFFAGVPETGALRAEIRLVYRYVPTLPSPQAISIEIASAESTSR